MCIQRLVRINFMFKYASTFKQSKPGFGMTIKNLHVQARVLDEEFSGAVVAIVNESVHSFHVDENTGSLCSNQGTQFMYSKPLMSGLTNVCYSHDSDALFFFVADGEILKASEYSSLLGDVLELQSIGTITDGIAAVEMDPSEELISLVSNSNRLYLFSCAFGDLTLKSDLVLDGLVKGTEEVVSVGWGKKETQFHGSLGKSAALAKEIILEKMVLGDDSKPRIAWRQDQHFCVSSCDASRGVHSRKIRVFSPDGVMLSCSEPVNGLEWPLDWCNDVNVIASTQVNVKGQRQVIFFERNGFRHHEFTLSREELVRGLKWNPSGNLLALLYVDGTVQLWTSLNYHWYLKHECRFEGADSIRFTADNQLLLSGKKLVTLDISLSFTTCGPVLAVVDGNQLQLTFTNSGLIPPPMCHESLSVGFVPNKVVVNESSNGQYSIVCQASNGLVKVFSGVKGDMKLEREYQSGDIAYVHGSLVYSLHDGALWNGGKVSLNDVSAVFKCRDDFLLVEENGQHSIYDMELKRLGEAKIISSFDEVEILNKKDCLYKHEAKLYLNDNLLMSNCLSFLVTSEFTFVTTSNQKLFSLPNDNTSSWSLLTSSDSETSPARLVENGAELVCCDEGEGLLVLLMPRGNFEGIYPRAMVISTVKHFLDKLDYANAYSMSRRHRLDLNFLHDHNPTLFVKNLFKFVTSIGNPSYLNIFLSSLVDENVAVTKYNGKSGDNFPAGKTKMICHEIITLFETSLNNLKEKYIDTVTTAYVCSGNVPGALKEILRVKEESNPILLEKSIKYLMFLVPSEQLYEEALGLYELSLALTIARRSPQMDPKEYAAFLDSLNRIEDKLSRQFTIDDHLKRHGKACKWLYEMGRPWNEFTAYVAKHKQYMTALKVTVGDVSRHADIAKLFGVFLQENGLAKEAGIMFALARCNQEFLLKNGLWLEALCVSDDALPVDSLKTSNYQDKLKLAFCQQQQSPGEGIISDCLSNQEWLLSVGLSKFTNQTVNEMIKTNAKQTQLKLSEITESAVAFIKRWEPLQIKFAKDPIAALLPSLSGDASADDAKSTVSGSVISRALSGLTSSTSASKKRQAKQRLRDKPGSPHERLYLQHAVNEKIQEFENVLVPNVKQLLRALYLLEEWDLAASLQENVVKFKTVIDDWNVKLSSMLTKQRDQEMPDMIVMKLLLDDSYNINIHLPTSWVDRSYLYSFDLDH